MSMFALGLAVALFMDSNRELSMLESALAMMLVLSGVITISIGYARYRRVRLRINECQHCGKISRSVTMATGVLIITGVLVSGFIALLAR